MNRREAFRTLGLGGLGLLVPWQLSAANPMPGQAISGTLRLGANENPYGPSLAAREAMKNYILEGNRYPFALAQELIEMLTDRNDLGENQVLLGAGSSELLLNAASWALEAGLPVVSADPVFPIFGRYVERFGGAVTHVPLNAKKEHDLPSMLKATQETPGIVYIVNPNNPTGTLLDRQKLLDFVTEASKSSYVLLDEAYTEFVDPNYGNSLMKEVSNNPKLIVLRTFSKVFGIAGMRMGYAMAHPETLRKFSSYQIWPNASANAAAIGAAIACLEDHAFVNMTIEKNAVAKQHVYDTLDQMNIRYIPSYTNFMIFDLKGYAGQFKSDMAKQNILLQQVKESDELWCRLSIGKLEEMTQFTKKLKQLW